MNRIDADQDEIEFERDESGGANDSGLSNHPPHLRLSGSSVVGYLRYAPVVVGFLPCVGTPRFRPDESDCVRPGKPIDTEA